MKHQIFLVYDTFTLILLFSDMQHHLEMFATEEDLENASLYEPSSYVGVVFLDSSATSYRLRFPYNQLPLPSDYTESFGKVWCLSFYCILFCLLYYKTFFEKFSDPPYSISWRLPPVCRVFPTVTKQNLTFRTFYRCVIIDKQNYVMLLNLLNPTYFETFVIAISCWSI